MLATGSTGGASGSSAPPLAGEAYPLAVADPGRDVDLVVATVAKRDLPSATPGSLLERQLELRLLIRAPGREAIETGGSPPSATSTKEALEEVAEPGAVAELDANVAKPALLCEIPKASGAGDVLPRLPIGPQAVVALPLLGVAQHLVGLGVLLEAVLGTRVLVDVRVVLASELAVGATNVVA